MGAEDTCCPSPRGARCLSREYVRFRSAAPTIMPNASTFCAAEVGVGTLAAGMSGSSMRIGTPT
jgi:hypothetical protein